MRFAIKHPLHHTNPRNCYVLTAIAMEGDADNFFDVHSKPFNADSLSNDAGTLPELVALCRAMAEITKNQWNNAEHLYGDLPGFSKFWGDNWPTSEWNGEPLKMHSMGKSSWSIVLYDHNGVAHAVEVVDA